MGGGRSHEVAREGFRVLREEEGIVRHDQFALANRLNTAIASCFSLCVFFFFFYKNSIFRFSEVSYKVIDFQTIMTSG